MDKFRDEMEKVITLVNSKSKYVYQLTIFIKKLKPKINYILRMYLKFVFHYPNDLEIFFIVSTLDTFCWKVLGAQVKPSRANLGVDPGDQTHQLVRWKAKAVIY